MMMMVEVARLIASLRLMLDDKDEAKGRRSPPDPHSNFQGPKPATTLLHAPRHPCHVLLLGLAFNLSDGCRAGYGPTLSASSDVSQKNESPAGLRMGMRGPAPASTFSLCGLRFGCALRLRYMWLPRLYIHIVFGLYKRV